ncbi:hypothetical protein IAU59_004079 [Kwoniella sp. CBS 9459]
MCISFFTLSQPGYKLILASNRDEFLARPTLPAGWHTFSFPSSPALPDGSKPAAEGEGEGEGWVLSGLDQGKAAGGTWLGITRDLRVGLLTNVRLTPPTPPLAPSPNPPSRGLLLKDFLSPPPPPHPSVHEYLSSHYESSGQYEGFNLLLFSLGGAKAEVGYLTNRPVPCLTDLHIPASHPAIPISPSHPHTIGITHHAASSDTPDQSGGDTTTSTNGVNKVPVSNKNKKNPVRAECFGISNSPMSEPWPKVQQGEKRMAETLSEWEKKGEGHKELVDRMFALLGQSRPIRSEEDMKSSTSIPLIKLPARAVTDMPTAPEDQQAAAAAAKPRYYGTRTATIILVKESGETIFVERDVLRLDEDGEPTGMFDGDDGERPQDTDRCFEFTAATGTA